MPKRVMPEFETAKERRAWLLARVEEVERRRLAEREARRPKPTHTRVLEYVEANPGATTRQIAEALGRTTVSVLAAYRHIRDRVYRRAPQNRYTWWPTPPTENQEFKPGEGSLDEDAS